MMDLARQRGLELDLTVLSRELGAPVVATVATQKQGIKELLRQVEIQLRAKNVQSVEALTWKKPTVMEFAKHLQRWIGF